MNDAIGRTSCMGCTHMRGSNGVVGCVKGLHVNARGITRTYRVVGKFGPSARWYDGQTPFKAWSKAKTCEYFESSY